jgi:hypothetical protein
MAEESTKPNDQFDEAIINSGFVTPANSKKKFKDTWEEIDQLCPTCGKVAVEAKGLNRQNMKRLFRFQTDFQSLTILFLMIMCGIFAYMTYSMMTTPINCSANVTDLLISQSIPQLPNPNIDANLCLNSSLCSLPDNNTIAQLNAALVVNETNQTE